MWSFIVIKCLKKFRNNNLKNYGFCPSHYLTTSALGCNAMLNITKTEFELIPDPGMYLFFEKGMRGLVSFIWKI